jgi:hypothetical protein
MCCLSAQAALLLAAVNFTPQEFVARDQVDLIEVNHYYDEAGKHVFDQLIFYDWSGEESRYHVRAWRLIKHPSQFPHRDVRADAYVATWQDGDVLRSVRGEAFRETWTQYDPELLERAALPKSQRRELGRVRSTSEQ